MEKNDVVNHPKHYTSGFETEPVECIMITRHLSFCAGNAFKYVWRAGLKGDTLEDLNKALWYILDIIHQEGQDSFNSASPAAIAAFGFVKKDDSYKYEILRDIVHHQFCSAYSWLKQTIDGFTESDKEN